MRGLPVETGENTPLIFLVPHLSMQQFNFAVSLINISGTLLQLLMASWADSQEIKTEIKKLFTREVDILRRNFIVQDAASRLQEPASPAKPPSKPHQGIKR